MPIEALTNDRVSAAYNSSLEAWGETGWATVARLCGWFTDNGWSIPFQCQPDRLNR